VGKVTFTTHLTTRVRRGSADASGVHSTRGEARRGIMCTAECIRGWGRPVSGQNATRQNAAVALEQAAREAATKCSRPCKLTFDLLTFKVVSE